MPVTLTQLVRVHSQATQSVRRYLVALEVRLSENKLLTKFGRSMDGRLASEAQPAQAGIRMPLRCEPWENSVDEERARRREQFWQDAGDDESSERDNRDAGESPRWERRAYARHFRAGEEDRNSNPEPLDEVFNILEMGLIIGDPGSGKTEWLKHQALKAVREQLQGMDEGRKLADEVFPPLFARLPELARTLTSGEEELKRLAMEECGRRQTGALDETETAVAALLLSAQKLVGKENLGGFVLRRLWNLWTNPQTDPQARRGLEGTPLLLCLDAWDEVPERLRNQLKPVVATLAALDQARIFATSRAVGYDPGLLPGTFGKDLPRRELRVLEFDWPGTEAFFQRFFEDEPALAQKLLADLRTRPQLHGLAANPLMATLLGSVFGRRFSGRASLSLPARRTEVYREVVWDLLAVPGVRKEASAISESARPEASVVDPKTIKAKLALLSALAFRFFPDEIIEREAAESFADEWLRDKARRTLRKRLKKEAKNARRDHILEVLARDDDALQVCATQEGEGFMFLHLTIEEFLAAFYVAREVKDNGWENAEVPFPRCGKNASVRVHDLVDRKVEDARWRELVVFLSGQLRDAEPMLGLLESGTLLPGDETALGGSVRVHDLAFYRLSVTAECLAETPHLNRSRAVGCAADRITQKIWQIWCESFEGEWLADRRALAWVAVGGGRLSNNNTVLKELGNRLADGDYMAPGAVTAIGPAAATHDIVSSLASILLDPSKRDWPVFTAVRAMGPAVTIPDILAALTPWMSHLGDAKPVFPAAQVALLLAQADWHGVEIVHLLGAEAATPEFLVAVAGLLADRRREVRDCAAEVVVSLGQAAACPSIMTVLASLLANRDGRELVLETVKALGQATATPEFLTLLTSLLGHTDVDVRVSAVETVGALGAAAATSEILASLANLLASTDQYERQSAAAAVESIGPAAATPEFLVMLTNVLANAHPREVDSANYRIYWGAISVVKSLGPAAATPDFLAGLFDVLNDANQSKRWAAIAAVEALGSAAATPGFLATLGSLLSDTKQSVREAVEAVRHLGPAAATPEILSALAGLLSHESLEVREAVAYALGALGPAGATPEILAKLAVLLSESNQGVIWALEAVKRLGPAAVTPKVLSAIADLLNHLLNYTDYQVRRAGEEALKAIGTAAATPAILTYVGNRLADRDRSAAQMVTALGPRAATPEISAGLADLLSNAGPLLIQDVARAVEALGPVAATPEIIQAITGHFSARAFLPVHREPYWEMEARESLRLLVDAIRSLGPAMATPSLLMILADLLADADDSVRLPAAKVVEALGPAAATPEILAGLASRLNEWNAEVIVPAIRSIGSGAATPEVLCALASLLESNYSECSMREDERWDGAWPASEIAAQAIGAMGPRAATPEILNALIRYLGILDRFGSSRKVLIEAVTSLGQAAEREILSALVYRLADSNAFVRKSAAIAVEALGPVASTPTILSGLARLFADSESFVRKAAIEAIKALGPASISREFQNALSEVWPIAAEYCMEEILENARIYRRQIRRFRITGTEREILRWRFVRDLAKFPGESDKL